jgi:hypothetical protein
MDASVCVDWEKLKQNRDDFKDRPHEIEHLVRQQQSHDSLPEDGGARAQEHN